MDFIKSHPAICMSVDGFSDVNSKSLFNVMADGHLSFVVKTFILEGKKASAANMDKEVSNVIKDTGERFWDSSQIRHRYASGAQVVVRIKFRGSSCVLFSYGCVCHTLSNLVKDICANSSVRWLLGRTIKLAPLFQNTHVASDLLANEKKKMKSPSQKIKSYFTTRLNRVAVLFKYVLDNKSVIGEVFTSHQMCVSKDRSLDLSPKSKALAVKEFATDRS